MKNIMDNDNPITAPFALSILKRDNPEYIFAEQVDNIEQSSSRLMAKSLTEIELNSNSNYKLYPNPASDFTTISYDCNNSNISYSIYDVQGRILITKALPTLENIDQNEVLIDLGALSPGTYQFVIQSDNVDWAEKLIVN